MERRSLSNATQEDFWSLAFAGWSKELADLFGGDETSA
jgi:hypothetical protein